MKKKLNPEILKALKSALWEGVDEERKRVGLPGMRREDFDARLKKLGVKL